MLKIRAASRIFPATARLSCKLMCHWRLLAVSKECDVVTVDIECCE